MSMASVRCVSKDDHKVEKNIPFLVKMQLIGNILYRPQNTIKTYNVMNNYRVFLHSLETIKTYIASGLRGSLIEKH